jgi:hypothetical protein
MRATIATGRDILAGVRVRIPVLATALAGVSLLLAGPAQAQAPVENPCTGPQARQLLCPDLRVGPAEDLFLARQGGGYGYGGGALLYAGNDIRSRGRGPIELRGQRYKRNWMRANQAIYRAGGGVEVFRTDAQLHFYSVGYEYGGSYWKVHNPLSMEIWSLDEQRRPLARVRKGPKVFYCFRDLVRTRTMKRSPHHRVYPACSQDPGRQRVRLGTSVGWSDIYPSTYDRQWVNVSGLRGCFAFVMRVDPQNLLYEEHENNNRSVRIVRLPFRDGPQRC